MRCSRRLATYVSISTTSRLHFWHSKRCVSTSSSLFSSSRLRQYVSIPSSVRCVDFTGTSRWCAADYHDGKLDEAPLFLMINVPRGRIGPKLRVLKLSISGVLAGVEWRLNTQSRQRGASMSGPVRTSVRIRCDECRQLRRFGSDGGQAESPTRNVAAGGFSG